MRTPLKNTALRLAAAALPAIALATLAPAPAQAIDWDHTMYTDDGDPGGRVRFEADGDIVQLCDIEADGWKVNLSVYHDRGDADTGYLMDVGGNGNCKTYRASDGGPFNLVEGGPYEFIIKLYKADKGTEYHDWAVWRA